MTSLLLLLALATARADLTDRILSVVGDDIVITLSELTLEEALRGLDVSPVPPFNDSSRDTLSLAEDLRILRSLAGDVRIFQPDQRKLDDRMDAIKFRANEQGGWLPFLAAHGVTEEDMMQLIRTHLIAEITVQRNVGLSVQDAHPTPGPERDEAYSAAYELWMAERRAQFPVRRVEVQVMPQGEQ